MQAQAPVAAQNPELVPTPPAPPAPPALPEVSSANARAVLRGKEQQREVLGEQMSRLLRRREDVLEQMQDPMVGQSERTVLDQHLQALNARIIDLEQQIQVADREWAIASAVPGAAMPERINIRNDGPPEAMLILGTILVGLSMFVLAVAWARRILRGGGKVVAQIPSAFENRFTRLEQSLDAVAIEVERISEGQRFLTRVFGEQNPRGIGTPAAEPIEVSQGERASEAYRRT